jgi:hypothetical protein
MKKEGTNMSWSLSAQGTKGGARTQLDKCCIYGTASDAEQACFDETREYLKTLVAKGYDCAPEGDGVTRAVAIFKAAASGHGTQVSSVSFSYEIAFLS